MNRSAVHEAGHWVACYHLRGPSSCGALSIEGDEHRLGWASTEEPWDSRGAEAEIVILLAGHAAERAAGIANGTPEESGAANDYQRAAELGMSPATRAEYEAKAAKLVASLWASVQALAEVLTTEKTLDGDEACVVVEATGRPAAELAIFRARRRAAMEADG